MKIVQNFVTGTIYM